MFLFARLMIAHLNAQPTVSQIVAEMSNLPHDLNEMYVTLVFYLILKLWANELQ